ncbi:MAG: ABC transporter ATP-binding protein [Methanothrix sp.]|jgi:peptide/nickel transport system ATP-binding protein|uniref:Nickel import system ATP-binding protein NikD n=1 Tax=Methanothrix harundinacea TaxID=301375 RepID=A0A117LF39_9EURY|nr:MAG: Oligopeptide/dipeptide ABC transporter, ATPase subunit [Methanothrix harundinacea]MDD3710750.1 ABC transporter ATP-binding protein [Methanothrix sp.]MDI9400034.1 ABC transporter ATP-binding protein [Euryarchaeota archaeon]KUK94727.1 MAG: Oligopeptide/dipeptide ABC transporter, ATPase subunit [Methanothrix harundinacea]MCP1393260.1 ABC transporter ATP-binding protein [Methanothrix harundinacea]
MLEICDLKVSYDETEILAGVDLDLLRGDSLAIIGESGAGKTTLGLAVMGLLEERASGRILLDGKDILSLDEKEMRKMRGKDIAMVFQNVEDALDPLMTVSDQIQEAISAHLEKGDPREVDDRVRRLLKSVGLNEDKGGSFPHQLSGGEKQRALIAMALANDPQVLILDEPTASLDAVTKAEITCLLRERIREKIVLVITHDISTAAKLAEKMAVLYAGRIVELGDTKDLLENPRHPYTRGLIRSSPNMTTTKDLQGIPGRMVHGVPGCPFSDRCTQRIDRCRREVPLLKEAGDRMIACHRGGIVPLLELSDVKTSFGDFAAVDGVDLTLYEGETIALVGESGSGKTTLAKTVIGLFEMDDGEGEIRLEGEVLTRRGRDFYKKVQMIYQNPKESISHRMNVLEAIAEPLEVQKAGSPSERRAIVKRVLEEVELPTDDAFLKKYPHQISGGEAQRVAIARALVLNPKLLIADEPTSALDASVQAKILKLLLNLQEKRGLAILFITHDIALARKVSDRMAVMLKGKIVEEGPTSDVTTCPVHPYTMKLLEVVAPHLAPMRGARETRDGSGGLWEVSEVPPLRAREL